MSSTIESDNPFSTEIKVLVTLYPTPEVARQRRIMVAIRDENARILPPLPMPWRAAE